MALNTNDNKFLEIAEIICGEGLSGLDKAVQIMINQAMLIERDRYLKAERYERTPERSGYANGFKPKKLNTRVGQLDLKVPQVRFRKRPSVGASLNCINCRDVCSRRVNPKSECRSGSQCGFSKA